MKDYVYPIVVLKLKAIWRILGFRFSFKGQENLKVKGGAVIAMNHVGYLDFAFVGTGALPAKRYIRFMAKKSIFDHKISGPLMRGMHHISVDRENGSTSFVAAMRALRAGELVGIFPEATISQSFEVKELKSLITIYDTVSTQLATEPGTSAKRDWTQLKQLINA